LSAAKKPKKQLENGMTINCLCRFGYNMFKAAQAK